MEYGRFDPRRFSKLGEYPNRQIQRLRTKLEWTAEHWLVSLTGRRSLYSKGWGDRQLIEQIGQMTKELCPSQPATTIQIDWRSSEFLAGGIQVQQGSFVSPASQFLPIESRLAEVEMILPRDSDPQSTPVFIHLASVGDQGFFVRRRFAKPLVKQHRFGVVILENPFYGKRKPKQQVRWSLNCISDQFAMNMATVLEARSLVAWLRQQDFLRVGCVGYSQGGFMAAFTAASSDIPMAVVCAACGNSSIRTFTQTQFSQLVNWQILGPQYDSMDQTKQMLAQYLEPMRVDRYPAPKACQAAVVIGLDHDMFVPAQETLKIHRHWPGSQLRWLKGGHNLGLVIHRNALRQAVIDAFSGLKPI